VPIVAVILVLAFIYSFLKFILAMFLTYTGTGAAISFLFLKIKTSYVTKKFNQFKEEEDFLKNFDIRN
jgi:hypothetical protein